MHFPVHLRGWELSLAARAQHRIPSCSSQFQLFGDMGSSGLTSHPENFLSGERIERHRVVSGRCYSESKHYPEQAVVLSQTSAGNWEREGEELKLVAWKIIGELE